MSTMESTRPASFPTHWTVDPEKSSVEFTVKTFWGLGTVRGRFERFDGGYDPAPDRQSHRVDDRRGQPQHELGKRDEHLRSADFFHIADHPRVRFRSTRVLNAGDGTLHIQGGLEAAGVVVPTRVRRGRATGRRGAGDGGSDDRRSAVVRHEQRAPGDDPTPGKAACHGAPERNDSPEEAGAGTRGGRGRGVGDAPTEDDSGL